MEPEPPRPRRKVIGTEEQSLKVVLTEHERTRKQTELLACHADLSAYERDEADIKAQLKRRKSAIENRLGNVVQLLQAGFEFRPVTVERIADYDAGLIRLVRVDTGEEIEIERMSESDRQTAFDFPPAADGYAEAGGPDDPYGAPPDGAAPIGELPHEPDVIDGEFVEDATPPDQPGPDVQPAPAAPPADVVSTRLAWYDHLDELKIREDLETLDVDDVRGIYARVFPGEVVGRAQKRTLIPAIIKALMAKRSPPSAPSADDDVLPF